jgi:hypothetical protein
VRFADVNQDVQLEFAESISLGIAGGFIKLSIVAFYRRIFVTHRGNLIDIVTRVTALIILLWTATFVLLDVFACGKHFWAAWSSLTAQLQYCPVAIPRKYGFAISDLILDDFIFLLPLPFVSVNTCKFSMMGPEANRLQIWKLQLTTKRKLAVSGIFLLGAS